MSGKPPSWQQTRRRSATLRRGLEGLAAEIDSLASGDETDAITGAAIVEKEVREWEALLAGLSGRAGAVLERLQIQRQELVDTFDQRLLRELRGRGLEVHGETAILIVNGIVHVESNLQDGTVK